MFQICHSTVRTALRAAGIRQTLMPLSTLTAEAAGREGVHQVAIQGFSLQVEEYERSRPGYPPSVVANVLKRLGLEGPGRKRVLDLASGTGKFTRRLIEHPNLEVVAVDQSREMNAHLSESMPSVAAIEGTATAIPAADSSFDAVFIAQGFHWFANEEACREIYRVLRPRAGFCCLWNREDVSVPWIKSILADLVEPLSTGAPQYFKGWWKKVFLENEWVRQAFGITDLDTHSQHYKHAIAISRQQLWGRILSKSYIALLPEERRSALKQEFERRLDQYGVKFNGHGGTEKVPLTLEVFMAFKQAL